MKCPKCNKEFPSIYYFENETTCRECFLAMNPEIQEAQIQQNKTLAITTAKGRAEKDAERLYTVADGIYKTLILFNWIIAFGGLIITIIAFSNNGTLGGMFGVGILFSTAFICLINYAIAVLSTHFAKVISNISLSLLQEK